MDLEVAVLPAKDGDAAAFMQAMAEGGTAALAASPGCRSVRIMPGIDNPGNVLFLVEWDSVAAHEAAKESEGFQRFFQIIRPFLGGKPSIEHFSAD